MRPLPILPVSLLAMFMGAATEFLTRLYVPLAMPTPKRGTDRVMPLAGSVKKSLKPVPMSDRRPMGLPKMSSEKRTLYACATTQKRTATDEKDFQKRTTTRTKPARWRCCGTRCRCA